MRAYKSGLGGSTSSALEALLAHPSTCLPVHQLNKFTRMGHGFAKILDPANPSGAPFYEPQRANSNRAGSGGGGAAMATQPQAASNSMPSMYSHLSPAVSPEQAMGLESLGNRIGSMGGPNSGSAVSPSIDFETLMMMHDAATTGPGGLSEQRIFEMDDSIGRSPNRSETRGPHEF